MKAARILLIFGSGFLLAWFIFTWLPGSRTPPITWQKDPSLAGLGAMTGKSIPLRQVIKETTGNEILPFDPANPVHRYLRETILTAAHLVAQNMSAPDSPARLKNRINEVSALFEDALLLSLDNDPNLSCQFPKTKSGEDQRSGYPDLRIEHLPSGTITYLDPKLYAATSENSTFRTFYFEPGGENSKVTEDALHLLIGFPHDSRSRKWTFSDAQLIDLSSLTVTLKTEFSASNKEVYSSEGLVSRQPVPE